MQRRGRRTATVADVSANAGDRKDGGAAPDMHLNSIRIFEQHCLPRFSTASRVLEVGPNESPSTYERAAAGRFASWHTVSLKHDGPGEKASNLTYESANEEVFPVESDRYDIVLSGQVIEHVRRPWLWLPEVARVCRPGGLVMTICPVSWEYHEAPIDCWRMHPEGLSALYQHAGLRVLVAVSENLDPPPSLRPYAGTLLRQAIKGFMGREPFLGPLARLSLPVIDTVVIGQKP